MGFVSVAQEEIIQDKFETHLSYNNTQRSLNFPTRGNDPLKCTAGGHSAPFQPTHSSSQSARNTISGNGNEILAQVCGDAFGKTQEYGNHLCGQGEWQVWNDLKTHKAHPTCNVV